MATKRSRRDEAGITLVELLVVMILLGVVGGIVTTAIVTTLQSASSTQARVLALNELENALQRVSRDLRVADPLRLSPDVTSLNYVSEVADDGLGLFGTDLGARITRDGSSFTDVRYRLISDGEDEPQRLVREDTGQTLVTLVDNGGVPVFAYLDAVGDELTCDSALLSLGACEDLLASAAQIRITLVREIEGRRAVQADTVVNVRSIRYGGG